MKIAYVVPRYGVEVVGGAEHGARMLAERLVSVRGWEVEVFTTCALDFQTWADSYPAGRVEIHGVGVHRFRSRAGRAPGFDAFSSEILAAPHAASIADQRRWIELQGPVCPDVVNAAATSDAELIAFYPYLYYPTVMGVPAVEGRAIMHPAAHDELPIRLPIFRDVFAATQGFAFHTHAERRLAEGLFPIVGQRPQVVLGLGVEPGEGSPGSARRALGLDDHPFLLCLGRVDNGKGAALLAQLFAAFKQRHPGDLKLVYVGPIVHSPPAHPDIIIAGRTDENTKWGVLRAATAVISPSWMESFSLAVLEAWSVGTPVMVNAGCPSTTEHVRNSGGGMWFGDFATFEVCIERLVEDDALKMGLGDLGRAYVERHFAWPVIIDRYCRFLEGVANRSNGH